MPFNGFLETWLSFLRVTFGVKYVVHFVVSFLCLGVRNLCLGLNIITL